MNLLPQFGAVIPPDSTKRTVTPPVDKRGKPMTWAQLARSEGHRRKMPKNPGEMGGKDLDQTNLKLVMAALQEIGPASTQQLTDHLDLSISTITGYVRTLRETGRAKAVGRIGNGRTYVLTVKA